METYNTIVLASVLVSLSVIIVLLTVYITKKAFGESKKPIFIGLRDYALRRSRPSKITSEAMYADDYFDENATDANMFLNSSDGVPRRKLSRAPRANRPLPTDKNVLELIYSMIDEMIQEEAAAPGQGRPPNRALDG